MLCTCSRITTRGLLELDVGPDNSPIEKLHELISAQGITNNDIMSNDTGLTIVIL